MSSPTETTYLQLFQKVTRMITSTLDTGKVLDLIARKIPDVIGVDAATIRLLDSSGRKLSLLAAHGLSTEYLDRGPVDMEKSVSKALMGSPVAIYDAATDARIHYSEAALKEGVKSILVAPIPIKGRVKGVLRLLSKTHRRFEEKEIEFITALAAQCGIAIENAANYGRITKLVEELRQRDDFLQNVMDSLNEELFVLDSDYRIMMVNRTFLESHHTTESEVIGRPCHQVIRVCDAGNCPLKNIEQGNRFLNFTRRVLEGNQERYKEVTASRIAGSDPDGKSDFIIGTIRDITAHVRLQEEFLLRERLQGVVEMAGAAAHELNTPVFAALGTAQLLLADINDSDPFHAELKIIIRNLKLVSELTKNMTRITRYEVKTYIGNQKVVDIRKASDDPIGEPGQV